MPTVADAVTCPVLGLSKQTSRPFEWEVRFSSTAESPTLNKELTDRVGDGGQPIGHSKLLKDVVRVIANGRWADVQPLCDCTIRHPRGQDPQHLDLAAGQPADRIVLSGRTGQTIPDE